MSTRNNVFLKNRLQQVMATTLTCSSLLMLSSFHSSAMAQESLAQEATQVLSIEAGDLGKSLITFTAQHNIALSFDPALTQGVKNPAVSGNMSPMELIAQLLSSTDLMMVANANGTYSLVPRTSSASNNGSAQLEVLIVTGEKVNKDIKDTTAAVTVISGEDFSNGAAQKVNDVATSAPNVISAGFGTINIRGINGSGATTGWYATHSGSRQRINTSIDGVADAYTGYNFSPSGVWDVDQIEIFRGSQSTAQGENSIGGAITINTNDPTFTPEAAVRLGLETYENGNVMKNLAIMSSGAITDDLAYRIAADGADGKGFMTYDGETDSVPVDPEESTNLNFRGKLLWKPTSSDDFTIKLTGNRREADGNYLNWANWSDGTGYEDETYTLSTADRNNVRIHDSQVNNLSAEVNYLFSNGMKSTTILSSSSQTNQFASYPDLEYYEFKDATNTVESRLSFAPSNSPVNGFVGVMLADREGSYDIDSGSTIGEIDETRIGLFGSADYQVTDKMTLIFGGRLQREEQDRYYEKSDAALIDNSITETNLLPQLAVTYAATESTTVGLSVRKGYNSGGIGYDDGYSVAENKTAEAYSYDSETVYGYEFSSKTKFHNGSTINAALFYNAYDGYQAASDNRIRNVTEAHTAGVEIEVTQWLTDNLETRQSVGYLTSKIDENSSYEGNELSNAPELNLSLGFTQYIGDSLNFGADLTYVGEYYSDLDNTDDYKAGNYAIVDANVDYEVGDFLISGYIKNLTGEDVTYLVNGGSRVAIGQSRTIGVSATYRM
ncbi:TonB-dependent receptor [Marinomonas sp. 5E14-1]|uniref:TonB-dependent receptor n=1 Tax=Marinomonas sp. 5E14-1 TaxID=3153922 RepID=UPI0032659086